MPLKRYFGSGPLLLLSLFPAHYAESSLFPPHSVDPADLEMESTKSFTQINSSSSKLMMLGFCFYLFNYFCHGDDKVTNTHGNPDSFTLQSSDFFFLLL